MGNKSDCRLDRIVTSEEGQTMANKNTMLLLETSAKTASNVEELFVEVGQKLCKQGSMDNYLVGKSPTSFGVILKTGTKQAAGCCRV